MKVFYGICWQKSGKTLEWVTGIVGIINDLENWCIHILTNIWMVSFFSKLFMLFLNSVKASFILL